MIISQRKGPETLACGAILLLLAGIGGCTWVADKEQVTFYHTYGYQNEEGSTWTIPLQARVYETSRRAAAGAKAVGKVASAIGVMEPQEQANLNFRLGELFGDDETGENVKIRFDKDTEDFPKSGNWKTNEYGLVEAKLELSDSKVNQLLQAQNSTDGWLSFHATSSNHSGKGRVHIIESTGVSVISDIDDTIKVTEVPAGKKTLFANTFLHKFQAVPEKERTDLYKGLEDKTFHYVSGSPWQLGKPLVEFLFENFPEGSIHMNNVVAESRNKLKDVPSIDELSALVAGDVIFEQKIDQITEIMKHFPKRAPSF